MKWLTLVAVLVGALAVGLAAERAAIPAGRSGRSVSVAKNGMVATSHPLAVQVGLDVLKQGGNAVDAAIAANAALGLMEPMSCGIGGDLFALVWDAKTQRLYGLNASGRAPKRATRQWFVERGYKEIPTTGPLSWSVPGCVDGWEELRRRFGTKSLAELLEPSIRYAEDGFPVPEVIAGYWRGAEKLLAKTPEASKTFMQDGRAPRAGELFRNPYLARTYRELAANGRETFYRGRIAREIVAYSERVGGLFSIQDFEEHTSTWVEPVSTTYRGYHVWQLPPPGQGIAVLQILNLLEPYDLKSFGPNSPDWWHLFIEAKKLAYADRARYYADPQFAKVPVAELISKPYAERRRQLIRLDKALTDVPAGDPKLAAGDTIYLCVVDKDRNCVSLIQSNYHSFGSGLVPGELGFALQNRGTLLSLDEQHANRLEPGKRPFHTIIPALVTKDGRPFFVFGVMGGDMQPQGQVQVLVNLLDFGMDVQAAGEAPRIEHVGSPTPTGRPGDPRGGVVLAEPGIPESVVEELKRRGHEVRRVSRNGGGYQGILIDWDNGTLLGGSEYRKDGYAAGY
ncbi:MAG: gamma-glutamyltransferase [Gemmatales bacterium]|nr:gamma-glutamyltransferase [Gemmatales bacterium]MDW8221774.1 gamma-glutamyltransferase [Gemmatales bacterium]